LDELRFVPGQYVVLSDKVGGQMVTRAYSICSPPDGNRFELCLNKVAKGPLSPHLFGLRPGDEVPMEGPSGHFALREPLGDSMMVATGTGVAPFRSMLRYPRTLASGKQFTLLLGARHEAGLLYRTEFEELGRLRPNFRFVPVLSRPEKSWSGRAGRVQRHTMELLRGDREVDVYVCGLKMMVDDMRLLLASAGFDRSRVIYEKYN